MAYRIEKINPLDLQPRKAIGVALPFSGRAVFNSTYQSKDAIKTNLINYFLTGTKERFFNVNFGAGLRDLLFNQITESALAQIKSKTITDLGVFFPRVNVIELNINSEPDTYLVTFFLRYQVLETNIQDEITINFEQ